MQTLLVAPRNIEDITGVASIKIGVRKITACNHKLEKLFESSRRVSDDAPIASASASQGGFLDLLKLVATRAATKGAKQ